MDKRLRLFLVVVAVSGMACADNHVTTATFQQGVTLPAHVQSSVTCSASGTSVTIGDLALEGLVAQIVMRNNEKGTHERIDDLAASLVVVPPGTTIAIPSKTVEGRPIAAPVVSVQFLDAAGHPVSGEIVLGSCASGSFTVDATTLLQAIVTLDVAVAGCANHPGPTITLEGAVTFSGLQVRVIVRDGSGGAIAGEVVVQAEILALEAGRKLSVPKQPVDGGVGGNPWIWIRLQDSQGTPLSDEILVGRCVQLAGRD
jgi:hypothetical protein